MTAAGWGWFAAGALTAFVFPPLCIVAVVWWVGRTHADTTAADDERAFVAERETEMRQRP